MFTETNAKLFKSTTNDDLLVVIFNYNQTPNYQVSMNIEHKDGNRETAEFYPLETYRNIIKQDSFKNQWKIVPNDYIVE